MRRLSAIMFTDMVGYSALTQKNEALALNLLEEHRKILRPFFSRHEGREIETAGDSFFVEFNSAVEAVTCAIEIQSALNERNKTQPEERHIRLRIGLHIGDVVYMDEHVHGDGVNIAARMEPLAQPGGICISEDVSRQIRNKVPYPIVKLQKGNLKNISMPMDIYTIRLPWLKSDDRIINSFSRKKIIRYSAAVIAAVLLFTAGFFFFKSARSSDHTYSRFRLAVLPLSNISNNEADEYFADGMTEELISSLSKISGLSVIARTSVMKYKTAGKDISQISDELMVGSLLEGSVRKIENKASITLRLIDAATQQPIWFKNYDRELKDIFMVQSEIAQSVANELKVQLVSSEKEQLEKSNTQNMVAFQEYLTGKFYMNKRTPENIRIAITHFQKSTEEDSLFALPYTSLAYCYTLAGAAGYGNTPIDIAKANATQAVMKALEIDPKLAEAHAALGYIKFRIDWDWSGAEASFKKAIELKPGYATAHEWYALYLSARVRLDEALSEMQIAYHLDPLAPNVNTGLARIYHFRKEYEKSIEQVQKTIRMEPNYAEAYFSAGMTYYKTKEYNKAEAELKTAMELSGRRPVIVGFLGSVHTELGKKDEANKLLKELEEPPMTHDKLYAIAFIKSSGSGSMETMSILEKLVDEKFGGMIYLKVEGDYFEKIDKKRYREMLEKTGL